VREIADVNVEGKRKLPAGFRPAGCPPAYRTAQAWI